MPQNKYEGLLPLAEDLQRPAPSDGLPAVDPDRGAAPVVSILVISYNTRAMTLDCLASVVEETTVPHEVIVVDNDSPDGSAASIAEAFPHLHLIASKENYGFAKGNNVAAGHARGKYILLLNPDTVVLDHAIDRIVAFAERTPEAKIWGGRTLHGDRSLNPGSVFGQVTLWALFCRASGLAVLFPRSSLFNSEDLGGWDRSDEREVPIVQGSFLLITRDLWETLGGFDLTYVMYGEEQDLCLRARRDHGARPRMTPEAEIIHFHGASSRRASREIMTLKGKATIVRRFLPRWQQPLGLWLLRIWPWSRMVSGKTLSRVTGRPRFAEAELWGEVWRARADWRNGYSGGGT